MAKTPLLTGFIYLLSHPSAPVQRRLQGLSAKRKFLAVILAEKIIVRHGADLE